MSKFDMRDLLAENKRLKKRVEELERQIEVGEDAWVELLYQRDQLREINAELKKRLEDV